MVVDVTAGSPRDWDLLPVSQSMNGRSNSKGSPKRYMDAGGSLEGMLKRNDEG